MTVKDHITNLLESYKELSVNEIAEKLSVSKQMIHRAIKQLLDEQVLIKLGSAPKTIYRKTAEATQLKDEPGIYLNKDDLALLEQHFLVVTDVGNLLDGVEAFSYWCRQRNLPVEKTLKEYISTKKKYSSYYTKSGLIDGTDKLVNTKEYKHIWLDKLYYLDFYAIERFGKTRLGTLLHYAKQGQNKFLMQIMMTEIEDRIKEFIHEHHIDAVAFVPPTVKRETQIMKFIRQKLNLTLPHIELQKISGIIPIPQKSLSKMNERIRNAENTFAVTDSRNFKHVLLIDDAVGSGSTLNQIAEKIKTKKISKKITGLAIVGSFKGFDVITDV
jgi:predicted DNA-binding protein YlxM (UPF0122 family)